MEPSTPHTRFVSRSLTSPSLKRRPVRKPTPAKRFNKLIFGLLPFWGTIWASVFLVGVVATGSLVNPNTTPDSSEGRVSIANSVDAESRVIPQPIANRGHVPVWLFGAIAVTCATGSILIAKYLYPTGTPRRTAAHFRQRKATPRAVSAISRGSQPIQPLVPGADPLPLPHPALPNRAVWQAQPQPLEQWVAVEAIKQQRSPSFSIATKSARSIPSPSSQAPSVPVTIVPVEEIHPLDLQEGGGTDMAELQRQRSLQFWFDPPASS